MYSLSTTHTTINICARINIFTELHRNMNVIINVIIYFVLILFCLFVG